MMESWPFGLLDREARIAWFQSEKIPGGSIGNRAFPGLYYVIDKFFIDGNGPFELPHNKALVLLKDPIAGRVESFELKENSE